jgi:DNA repair protein RadC
MCKKKVDLSRNLLNKFGTFKNIDQTSITEICQIQGIVTANAAQIKAALEVSKRLAAKSSGKIIKIKSSRVFFEYYSPFLKNLKKGIVNIGLLDPKLKFIK